MTVAVRVPTILRPHTGGEAVVHVPGGTLAEVLAALDVAYPGLGGRVVDADGALRRFVNVYVDDQDVRFEGGLGTPTRDGATVSIIPAVAGGCRVPEGGGQGRAGSGRTRG
jgi:molybdopterin converting factor small subunit